MPLPILAVVAARLGIRLATYMVRNKFKKGAYKKLRKVVAKKRAEDLKARKELKPTMKKGFQVYKKITESKAKKRRFEKKEEYKKTKLKEKEARKEIDPIIKKGLKVRKKITEAKLKKERRRLYEKHKLDKKDIDLAIKKGAKVYKKVTGKTHKKQLTERQEFNLIRKKYPY